MFGMFKSAVFKLTAWYMGALLIVCFVFSIPIYTVASDRLRRGAQRQTEFVRQIPSPFDDDVYVPRLIQLRDKQLENDQHQLLLSLILINVGIVGIGAYASYLFARRTLKPLERVHAAQVRFTADASHELRTPLAVMQTEIEVALRNKKLPAKEARDVLESNLEEVARLRELSDQLLGLTRAGAEPLKRVSVNAGKFVTDQMHTFSRRFKKPITVDAPKSLSLSIDKVLISQALGIIVENAVVYSGQDDPQIAVKVTKGNDNVSIAVTNQGAVIPSSDQQRLFERFYRGARATAVNPKGHGLGLSLVKDIVLRHGGGVHVSSSKKAGTVFTIILPANPQE